MQRVRPPSGREASTSGHVPAAAPRGPRGAGRRAVTARASAYNERVLRYPDGRERRIRYPALPPTSSAVLEEQQEEVLDYRFSTCEELGECWETCEAYRLAGQAAGHAGTAERATPPAVPHREQLPESPMELLRLLTSDAHRAAQRDLWEKVRRSYEVMEGCPWVTPRPVFVLACAQPGGGGGGDDAESGLAYSLRTRVERRDLEGELTQLLGRRRPDGSAVLSCSELRDGVVVFESEADAESFGCQLEEEGGQQVYVASYDSHSLFRSVSGARGVVVLLRRGGAQRPPRPHELAASLRARPEPGAPEGGAGRRGDAELGP